MKHRWRARCLRAAALLLAVVVLVVGWTAVRIWQVAREDSRAKADAIVVLGASQFDGRPSAVFRSRLDHAKALYDSGVANVVVTVGGNRQGDRFTEAGAGATYLRQRGVDVVAVEVGSDTLTSLQAVARIALDRRWRSVLIVTDPWHSFRARTMARQLKLHAATSPTRAGPVVHGRAREARYIARETAAYLYYKVFKTSFGRGPSAV